ARLNGRIEFAERLRERAAAYLQDRDSNFNSVLTTLQMRGWESEIVWLLHRAEQMYANNPVGLGYVANHYAKRGDDTGFERVRYAQIALKADSPIVLSLALHLDKTGRLEQAIQLLTSVCERVEDSDLARRLIGLLLRERRTADLFRFLDERIAR